MEKYAFKMKLFPGKLEEYRRRHDQIWPELVVLLRSAGVRDYSIYFDPDTHTLFAVLWRSGDHTMDQLPQQPVMQKWWAYMADLMETWPSQEPVAVALERVFHLE